MNVASAIPDAALVIVIGLPVPLAIRGVGGRRGRVGDMQLMLMMVFVQPVMMPAMAVLRGGGRADLQLHMQRHARGQGERRRALVARAGGRVGADRVDGRAADAAGDRAGGRGGGRVVR